MPPWRAPEENELVVDTVLGEAGDTLRLRPSSVPGLVASPGLTQWQGRQLHPDLHRASRIWPQQNDTGGFFVAVLEKTTATRSTPGAEINSLHFPRLHLAKMVESEPWLEIVTERFGMDTAVFAKLSIVRWSHRGVYLVNQGQQLPTRPRLDSPGLFFMRVGSRYPKLTTAAAMLLGQHATRNWVELTLEQAKAYLQRQTITPSPDQTANCTGTGFVVIRFRTQPLGLGLFHASSNQIETLFPKAWSRTDVQI